MTGALPHEQHCNDRYVPRALPSSKDGWAVYDRLKDKFLTDEELELVPVENLKTEQLPKN